MEQEFDIRTYVNILRRRYLLLIIPALLVFTLAVATAYMLPRVYNATALILVESQQIPNDLARTTVTTASSEQMELIQQRLMARSNLLEIARNLNLYSEEQKRLSPTEIAEFMREAIQIEPLSRGNTSKRNRGAQAHAFSISFDYGNPQIAARVANELVKLIVEQNIRSRMSRASETHKFFELQVEEIEKKMAVQEAAIIEFKSKNESALPESMAYRRTLLTELQSRIPEIDQKLQVLEAQKEFLTPTGNSTVLDDAGNSVEDELAAQRARLRLLQASYSDRHPAVKKARKRVAALEKATQTDASAKLQPRETNEQPPRISREVAAKLTAIEQEMRALREQKGKEAERIAELEKAVLQTPQVEIALNALTREYESLEHRLGQARAKMAEAATGEQLEEDRQAERFEIIEPATAPTAPAKPDRRKIVLAGLFVSLAAGIGMVLLFELLDQSIRDGADLQKRLQIRPLTTVPLVYTAEDKASKTRKLWIFVAVGVLSVCAVALMVHVFVQPIDLILAKILQKAGI